MGKAPLVIKKYGNRRLYDTEQSSYITLEDLAALIRSGRDVKVVDAKTGSDLTKSVLLQLITEREKEHDLIPVSFLKKMIQLGDATIRDSLQRYLSVTLDGFVAAQEQFEEQYRQFAGSVFNPMMWMMDPMTRAMSGRRGAPPPPRDAEPPPREAAATEPAPPPEEPEETPSTATAAQDQQGPATQAQIDALKAQMSQIQEMLSRLDRGGE